MWKTMQTLVLTVIATGVASPQAAEAATYKVCVRVIVQTSDTGLNVNGVTEDHYLGTDAAAGLEVVARGFRVMLLQQEAGGSVWADVFDANTSEGCFSFSRGGSNVYSVVVQGYATDGEDNHIRIHTGGTDTSTWFPLETIDRSFVNQPLGSENYFVIDGVEDDRWTTIAVAAFGLYRWDNGTSDTIISIGFSEDDDDDGCGDSSSMYGDSTSYIESLRAHLDQDRPLRHHRSDRVAQENAGDARARSRDGPALLRPRRRRVADLHVLRAVRIRRDGSKLRRMRQHARLRPHLARSQLARIQRGVRRLLFRAGLEQCLHPRDLPALRHAG